MDFHVRLSALTDVEAISRLHTVVLGYTLNARLGHPHLCRLYRGLMRSPHGVVFAAYEQERLIGFVSGTSDAKLLQRDLIRMPGTRILLSLALGLARRPWLISKLITQYQINRPVIYRNTEVRASLLTIGTHPAWQGKGVGRQMVQTLMDEFRRRSVEHFHLNTKGNNHNNSAFYHGLGGQVHRSWRGNDIYLFVLNAAAARQGGAPQGEAAESTG
jgi:ribosomal protein S18 acetylase RimI-like enzyme